MAATNTVPAAFSLASLRDIPAVRQLVMLVGLAAAIAGGISIFTWAQRPAMEPLYPNLSGKDAAEVADALRAANIEYRLDASTGAVTVAADKIHEARLQLAGQGLPKSSGSAGFEMIQQEQGFGTSQFIESARYQHALEVELARTVGSLQPVQSARVHLALPKPSAFARGKDAPSASVLVALHAGRTLEDTQVASIVHLVASSVPDLSPDAVTVIDQYGRLLTRSDAPNSAAAASAEHFDQARRLEADYVRRIEALLTPVTGPGRVSAQVAVDLDFSETEEASETYKPESAVVRSEQTSEESNRASNAAQGVPGATSNQPPSAANAKALNALEGDTATNGASAQSRRSTKNYELDKTLSHTRRAGATLKRLSVAVLVDNIPQPDGKNGSTLVPLKPEQLQKLEALVREAVGFDEKRGDSLSVQNVSFMSEAAPAAPEALPLWQRADLRDYARQGLGIVVVLVLIFAVLRPALRTLLQPPPVAAPTALTARMVEPAVAEDRLSLGAPAASARPNPYDEKLAQARGAVGQDPKRVAQVMKTWIGENG